jgi:hypothetical protein
MHVQDGLGHGELQGTGEMMTRLLASLLAWVFLALQPAMAETVTFAPGPPWLQSAIATPPNQVGTQSQAIFFGLKAGASFPFASADNYGSLGIGSYALNSLTTTGAEDTAVGGWAAQFVTTGALNTAFGMHALGSEVTQNNNTALGDDAMRDVITSAGGVTAVGSSSVAHGADALNVTAIGLQSGRGNSGGVLIGGAKTTGDVVSITVAASGSTPGTVAGLPVTASRTVTAGDTLSTIAANLASQFGALITGPSYSLSATSTDFADGTSVVSFFFPGSATTGWALTITSSVTGAATETLTNLAGSAFQELVAVGTQAAEGNGTGTLLGVTAVGYNALRNVTTGTLRTAVGDKAGFASTTADKDVLIGYTAGAAITTGGKNHLVGYTAGAAITTGFNNTIFGYRVGSAVLVSGHDNVLIGTSSNIDTAAAGTSNTIQIGAGSTGILFCTGTGTPSTAPCALSGTLGVTGITADTAHTDASVCEDTTSHVFYSGTGAAGICLGTSSLRFKDNVAPLDHGLADIMRLDTIAYNYKPDSGMDTSRRLYGFAAEQVNTVMPELVGLNAIGEPNSVDWAGIVPVLVHAIQELQGEVLELRRMH